MAIHLKRAEEDVPKLEPGEAAVHNQQLYIGTKDGNAQVVMDDTDVTEPVWAVYEQDGRDPPDVRALCMTRAGAEKQARRYDKEPHSGAMYVVPCRPAWDEREQIR